MPANGARPKSIAPGPPASDQLIAGKYRFERVIGEGAMGTVIGAHHELLDVSVAVKLLSSDFARQPNLVARFLREARSAARLKSEHVARVMDVGTLETGQPFIVMELLEGEDLDKKLVRMGRLPIHQAVDYVLQALEAIAQAHAIGIVHRDLKPANLFLSQRPDGGEIVKVLDFGVAKFIEAKPEGDANEERETARKRTGALTGEHAAIGSPSYMSPEQVRDSSKIDHRADLWAMGTILYEMATGAPAFDGQSVGEIFGAILHSTPAPISTGTPEGAALEEIVRRCLERDADQRWGDAAQLARALAPLGSGAWTGHVERIEQTLARAGKKSDPDGLLASSRLERADRTSDPDRLGLSPTPTTFPPPPVSGMRARPRFETIPPPPIVSAPSEHALALASTERVRASAVSGHARISTSAPADPMRASGDHVRASAEHARASAETMLDSTRPPPPARPARVGARALLGSGALVGLAVGAVLLAAVHTRGRRPATTSDSEGSSASAMPGDPATVPSTALMKEPSMAPAPAPEPNPPAQLGAASESAAPPASAPPSSPASRPAPRPQSGPGKHVPAHVSTTPGHKPALPSVLDSPD